MEQELFTPVTRDKAIETTISNLVQAGILLPGQVSSYMGKISKLDNYQLAEQLCASRLLLDSYYETCKSKN